MDPITLAFAAYQGLSLLLGLLGGIIHSEPPKAPVAIERPAEAPVEIAEDR